MAHAYLYVFPLHAEDWLKVGMSTNPLRRAQEFHRRFYDVFDLSRAFLIETESARDAAALEGRFRDEFSAHRSAMPLSIRQEAGGFTEWYRGAHPALLAAARELASEGFNLIEPSIGWFARALDAERPTLHAWASALLRECLLDPDDALCDPLPQAAAAALRDAVDAFRSLGLDVDEQLPRALQSWYRGLPPPKNLYRWTRA